MKTYISFTTIPSRINKIKKTVDSLLNQSLLPDKIYIWLPKKPLRDKTVIKEVPEFLNHDLIEVKFVEDLGSATKLLPALKEFKGQNCNIVTVDDDVYYPKNWLKTLLAYEKNNPNVVIGYRGRVLSPSDFNYNKTKLYASHTIDKPINVDIITGTWGALYKPNFFDDEVFNLDLKTPAVYADDIWFTGHLWKNKIPIVVIPLTEPINPTSLNTVASLWEINKVGQNNNYTINLFKKYL